MQQSQLCVLPGHNSQVTQLCIWPGCTLNRFVCFVCMKQKTHKHQAGIQWFLKDCKELQTEIQKLIAKRQLGSNLNTGQLKQIIQENQNVLNMISDMVEEVIQFKYQQQLNEIQLKLEQFGFDQMEQQDVDILMNSYNWEDEIVTQISNFITKSLTKLKIFIDQFQKDRDDLFIKDAQLQQITLLELNDPQKVINSSDISNDLKYIACSSDQQLMIWNFDDNKQSINPINLQWPYSKVKFSLDSKLLCVGIGSILRIYKTSTNFGSKDDIKLHQKSVMYILWINDQEILTSSFDYTIKKINVKDKTQLMSFEFGQNEFSNDIDYHHKKDTIACCQTYIKIFDGKGQLIMEEVNPHKPSERIQSVKFLSTQSQLLSLSYSRIIDLWKIDYEQKKLEKLKQFYDPNTVCSISLVQIQNKEFIVLVCDKFVKICSIKELGSPIKKIEHDVKILHLHNLKQSMQGLVVQGKNMLQIIKLYLE